MKGRRRPHKKVEVHPEGRMRDAVLEGLIRIDGGAWVDRLSPAFGFSDDDRRRITELLAGVTRLRRRLDFYVDHYAARPESIDEKTRNVLRMAVYEIVELGRSPHAVVFAAVEQAKRIGRKGVERFVNGLLRTLVREIDRLPVPATGNEVADIGIRYSHPDWIVRRWMKAFGTEAATKLLEYDNERPVHSLRVNTMRISMSDFARRLDELGVAFTTSPYLDEFVRVTQMQTVIGAGLLAEGLAAVQDESAGLVSRVLDPQPGEFVIDACSAPCGKLIHAGLLMENKGRLLGVDPNKRRLAAGLLSSKEHGLSIVETIAEDFRQAHHRFADAADAVLVDAPCSGLGVLARRADLRWSRGEGSIPELVQLQDELLDAAARCVRPGGRLVYGTCTITPEENEERVAAFLRRHPSFSETHVSGSLPDSVVRSGRLETLPHLHGIDGAFAVCLTRTN